MDAISFKRKFFNIEIMFRIQILMHIIITKNILHSLSMFLNKVTKWNYLLQILELKRCLVKKNVPANTEAFDVIIGDKIIKFQADWSKMSVIQ